MFLHRIVAVISLYVVAWALVRLALRCGVSPQFALWLGVLNPLTLLHLVGGVHNEALLLALLLSGLELCLVALHGKPIPGTPDQPVEPRAPALSRRGWLLFAGGVALISLAGMVKVTGFVALGFVGMALARRFGFTTFSGDRAAACTAAFAAVTIVSVCLASGLGFGWITSQGGATVRSWMSLPTLLGIAAGFAGRVLGIGDVSEAALALTRGLGILLAVAWLLRMLWATFRGRIHPLGGYGLAMFALVLLFPVVAHPWYLLWALVPLSGWARTSSGGPSSPTRRCSASPSCPAGWVCRRARSCRSISVPWPPSPSSWPWSSRCRGARRCSGCADRAPGRTCRPVPDLGALA